jgi:toxin ParE1/3/4
VIALGITEAAALSIVEQADYYRSRSGAKLAARWEAAVDKATRSLLELPERGSPCRFRAPALADMRWIPVPGFRKHLIFYRYLTREKTVLIVEVLHGARDLEAIFEDEEEAE